MQPIMETIWEDDVPGPVKSKPRRFPVLSSNFYPLTVLCWVLSVATVGVIVGLVCTEFFDAYTSLLRNLGAV